MSRDKTNLPGSERGGTDASSRLQTVPSVWWQQLLMGDASKIVVHRCPEPIVNRLERASKGGV